MDELEAVRKQLVLLAAINKRLKERIRQLEHSRDLWRHRATRKR